jgi:hypothetical protein
MRGPVSNNRRWLRRWGAFGLLAAAAAAQGTVAQGAGLSPAIRDFDGSEGATASLPKKLSQTGLYQGSGPEGRIPADGLQPFDVNSALWSDGAAKERFLSLPTGTKVVPTDTDGYGYPEGTVFIKNFRVDTVYGDPGSRILVETRFLVRRIGGAEDFPWHGITYRWARDQSDADLVSQDLGENILINVRQNGVVRGKRWTYPSKHQCVTCHFGRGILGFITPQLNRPSRANASVNQLQDLKDKGVLSSNPIAGRTGAFRWAGIDEAGETLELRARSYFASNCSHCHGNGPPGTSPGDHVFEYFHPEVSVEQGPEGLNGAYIGKITHQGGDEYPQFIYKGYPESSYVFKRMLVRQDLDFTPTEQMPTMATFQPDSAGLNLIRNWVCALGNRPAGSCRLPQVQSDASYWDAPAGLFDHGRGPAGRGKGLAFATLSKGILRMEPGSVGSMERSGGDAAMPRLQDLRGRPVLLMRTGRWEYRTKVRLEAGLYLLSTGAGTRALFNLP